MNIITKYRTKHNVSVRNMAEQLNITRQHLYEIERETAWPSRKLALKIQALTDGEVKAIDLLCRVGK